MKGYLKDNVLFVFPQTADTIPFVDSDVTVINVQQEDILDWKEENESHADIIFPYNYNVMTVQPKVWSGHENDDIYVPVTPELEWSASTATVTIGADDNVFPTLTNPHSVTVSYSSSDSEKATIDTSTGEITLVAEGDTTISAVFAGDDTYEAQTVTYTLTVQQAQPTTYSFNINEDGNEFTVGSYEEGDSVDYTFDHALQQEEPGIWHWEYTMSPASLVSYNFSPGQPGYIDTTDPENPVEIPEVPAEISFTMPANDVTFTITMVMDEQSPE